MSLVLDQRSMFVCAEAACGWSGAQSMIREATGAAILDGVSSLSVASCAVPESEREAYMKNSSEPHWNFWVGYIL